MQLQIIQSYKYPEHDIDIHEGLMTVAQKAQIRAKKKPQIKKKIKRNKKRKTQMKKRKCK